MHSLLERQLRKAGFNCDTLPTDPSMWREFLVRIERFYINADRERELLENNVKTHETNAIPLPLEVAGASLSLQNVIAAMDDGFCIFNARGHVVYMNPAAEKYLQADHSQLTQMSILDKFTMYERVNAEKPLTTDELIKYVSTGQKFHNNNVVLKQSENITIPVSFELNAILQNGDVLGSLLFFSDITDLKIVEAELIIAKENAEKSSQAKSQFLSSMSHELRTPMNAILGYSELLKEDLSLAEEDFDPEGLKDMQQYVGNILQAGWHLLELINKVLDLTRIEAGKLEVIIDKVELIDLIKDCISLIIPAAEKDSITILNETDSSSPQFALADRARLKQVILNLLSNAVKYNREHGKIFIRLTHPSHGTIRLEVEDTGIGLMPDQKSKIFEPFTRLSGVNLIEGTGIGLTITKRLLEIMDGKIGVESKINIGSTFWVDLPTDEMNKDSTGDTTAPKDDRYILLYVEDSRTNVSLVAQILKARPDIALMSAHTGEMGLKLARMHNPDIILLDINLPGMDGFEVLEHLRLDPQTADIPVLALTANDRANNVERSREAGFLSYIVKPLDIKQFLEAIDAALEKSISNRKQTVKSTNF